jgi:hypothetical protein
VIAGAVDAQHAGLAWHGHSLPSQQQGLCKATACVQVALLEGACIMISVNTQLLTRTPH